MDDLTPTIEHLKAVSEHFKHITTLASGFIIVIATLLEKVFQNPEWLILIAIALIAFTLATLFSMIAQSYFIDFIRKPVNYADDPKSRIAAVLTLGVWGFFLMGIVSLVIFTAKNIL